MASFLSVEKIKSHFENNKKIKRKAYSMESMWHGWSKLYSFFFRITISQFMNFSKAQSRCNMVEDIESMPWYIRHNHAERKKNEKKLWFSCKVSWCAVIRCYVEYRWSFFAYNTYCAKPWRKRNAMWLAITRSIFICGIYHKGKKWPTLSLSFIFCAISRSLSFSLSLYVWPCSTFSKPCHTFR